ncbi:hypothetical protein HanIR_Chr13g0628691 [Helianthus annuus]|nr:hypothetical protein HanIR_Chr13g0628691 [Helianthus annuus]
MNKHVPFHLLFLVLPLEKTLKQHNHSTVHLFFLLILKFLIITYYKQSSSCRLQRFGPPLLLQMSADVVRRLQIFYLRKNKQHLNDGN